MIDRTTVERILDAAKIEEVVGDFVTLRRAGANLKGLCPFHDDRTPSFMVSPAKNICKCFACGKGGTPVHFIMEHEGLSYPEALRYLARKYNIEVQERELTNEERAAESERESLFVLNEWAHGWFQSQLNDTIQGRTIGLAYFRQRGFRDDIIKKFQLGFCPDKMDAMWQAGVGSGYNGDLLIKSGLCIKNETTHRVSDRFRGRVIFPIHKDSGRVVGFGGRVLASATKGVSVKYQNSPESAIYSKSRELYGLYFAKKAIQKTNVCYLVEGYTDVMAMHQSGVENVVASSGTALTYQQIQAIHRLTENIVVIYDGDAAGIKASQRGIDMLLEQGMKVRLLLLPDEEDPDSFARKHTAQEFQEYLAGHQVDFIRFKTNLLMQEAQNDPILLSRLINNIVESISVIPNEIERTLYIKETSQMLTMDERIISRAVSKRRKERYEERRKAEERNANLAANTQKPVSAGTSPTETPDTSPAPQTSTAYAIQPEVIIASTSSESPLYAAERLLVQAIIRHGEKTMGEMTDDEGHQRPVSVLEFIDYSLHKDNMQLEVQQFHHIYAEAVQHMHDPHFCCSRHFTNHPDPEVSTLSCELCYEQENLSKMYENDTSYKPEGERLLNLIPHIMAEYKLAYIEKVIRGIQKELANPEILRDKERTYEVLQRFNDAKAAQIQLSKQCGNHIFGKK